MANYKLSNDYWETSGVYDITQGKTQREINADLKTSAESTIKPETVSGGIASFEGAEGVPLKNLTVNIEPVQSGSGDPSPENVRPITGWTGANVYRSGVNTWNEQWELGQYDDNGQKANASNRIRNKTPISVVPNTSYYFLGTPWIFEYDTNNDFIQKTQGNRVVTVSANTHFVNFQSSTGVTTYGNNISVNYPSTDTEYHAYTGATSTITFPSEAGTVYGGTLDVTNGTLIVNKVIASLNDSSKWISYTGSAADYRYDYSFIGRKLGSRSLYMCSAFECTYAGANTPLFCGWLNNDTSLYIGLTNAADKLTLAEVQSMANNNSIFVVYEIATPVTYTLTPIEVKTLLGTNNIWADCGDVDVEYGAYLTVVENQLGERIPKVAVAPIEKTTTASKAYSVNEMFFMGDKLYIATSSIASGATFTVGTNCDETTLGEQITALLNA